jgi:hypothetical protein
MLGLRAIYLLPMLMTTCGVQADKAPAQAGAETLDAAAVKGASSDASIEAAAPVETAADLPADAGKLPPATRKHRFAGRWAESLAQCRTRAWWLHEGPHGVSRPDGQRCDLHEVRGRSRYRAIAWCTPALPQSGQLSVGHKVTFAFDEAAQRMNADGLDFPDTGLVFCGTED